MCGGVLFMKTGLVVMVVVGLAGIRNTDKPLHWIDEGIAVLCGADNTCTRMVVLRCVCSVCLPGLVLQARFLLLLD